MLFNINNSIQLNLFVDAQLKSSKYYYVSLTIQLNKSFVYTPLNDQTVLFLTIWLNQNHLFAHSLNVNVKLFYLTHRWDPIRYNPPNKSGPESNSNEGVHHIPQSSWAGASLSDGLVS